MTRNLGPNTECSLSDSERETLAAQFETDLRIAIEWAGILTDDTTLEGLIRACLDQNEVPKQVEEAIRNVMSVPFSRILGDEVPPLAACIAELISQASDTVLFVSCGLRRSRASWRQLGCDRGITGEAARRKFAKDALLIRGLLASDRFRSVRWAAMRMQADFGSVVPADSRIVEHWKARLDEDSFEALRWLANYIYDDDWILQSQIGKISDILQKLNNAIGNAWLLSTKELEDVVVELGYPVRPETSLQLLRDRGSWRDIGDGWLVRWDGTLHDKGRTPPVVAIDRP